MAESAEETTAQAMNKRPWSTAEDQSKDNGQFRFLLILLSTPTQSVEASRRLIPVSLTGELSSSEDDFGPAFPSAAPKKKRRRLAFEKVYVNALPSSSRYSRSLMHKDQLSFVTITPHTDFLITSSLDGVVKFWKKMAMGVEFVKEFRVHDGEIRGASASADGRSFATAGADNTVKIFDVITFGTVAAAATLGRSSILS